MSNDDANRPGEFGDFGGRYVPEVMDEPLDRLSAAFDSIAGTEEFREEFRSILENSH